MALPPTATRGGGQIVQKLVFDWTGKGDGQLHEFKGEGNNAFRIELNEKFDYDIEAYEITAIPADGWRFDHWEYREEYKSEHAYITGGTETYTKSISSNPAIGSYDTSTPIPIGRIIEKAYSDSGEWQSTYTYRCVGLIAFFVRAKQVAKLVYDPYKRKLIHAGYSKAKLLNGM